MSEDSAPKFHTVKFDKDAADRVRSVLDKVVQRQKDTQGDEIAGFALVTWDRRGSPSTGFLTSEGMVHRQLMPSFVRDALQSHVAVDIAQEGIESNCVPPDDSA